MWKYLALWCALQSVAMASPTTMMHQGRLLDVLGVPAQGTLVVDLSLYPSSSATSAVWSETNVEISLQDGYYAVALGENTPLAGMDFGKSSYWLEVQLVGGDAFTPRSEIHAVPVAMAIAGAFQPTAMTTGERNGLSVNPGAVIYNSTEGELQTWDGASWDALGSRGSDETLAYAFGDAQVGGLGTADSTDRNIPWRIEFPGDLTFQSLAAGGYSHGGEPNGCGVGTDGRLFCWGRGNTVPNGTDADSFIPADVSSGMVWRDVRLGHGLVGCGVTVDDDAFCWGYQVYGGLGNGVSATSYLYTPQAVIGGIAWKSLRPGGKYDGSQHRAWLCGVSTTTGADNGYCWGYDYAGSLGNGSAVSHNYTDPVAGLISGFEWSEIDPGSYHNCGVTVDGDGYCWGEGASGRLGTGNTTDQQVPTPIAGSDSWVTIEAGHTHSCGLKADGDIACWGDASEYQLGRGTTTDSNVPVPVTKPAEVTHWTNLSVGYQHTCALDQDRRAWCWGHGGSGRLGDAEGTDNLVPTRVVGDLTFDQLAAGIEQTYGLRN